MHTPKNSLPALDELFEVEMQIAKRADELVRLLGADRGNALEYWRRAEREVWPEHAESLAEK